jgi:hypothetical protein
MLEPLARPDSALEAIELRVDPEVSNLARDRVALVGSARMRWTRWSADPSNLDLAVNAQVTPQGEGPREARIDAEAHVSTNVIALANYGLPKFAQSMTAPPDEKLSGHADVLIKQRVAEKLARVGEITSMDDLADVFTHVTALRMMTLNEEVERLRARIDAEPDNHEVVVQLHAARLERDKQFDSRPTIERNPSGAVEAIHLVMKTTQPLQGSRVNRYDVRVTAHDITVSIGGTTRDGVAIYTVAKPAVVRMLARIQARDPEAIDLQRGIVGAVVNRWIDEIAGPPPRPLPQ